MNSCKLKIFREAQDYDNVLLAMQEFTNNRNLETPDEIWLLEHHPVYTYGAHTKPNLPSNNIPKIASDRGGNVTYHAPGQIIIYPILDTKRLNYSIHGLVERLEHLTIEFLELYRIQGRLVAEKRGVYVGDEKIASLGLRFKKYCSYHGLAINIDLDLTPFKSILPCGYQQEVTSMQNLGININCKKATEEIVKLIPKYLELKIEETV